MKFEIRSHCWPKTPTLREIKLLEDGFEIASGFIDKKEITKLSMQFDTMSLQLIEIAASIE